MAIDLSKFSDSAGSILRTSIEKSDLAKMSKKDKPKKKFKSYKPLVFEVKDSDTPIKRAIIEQINSRNYTYDDLKDYYAKTFPEDGHGAYNIIETLDKRKGLVDKTISIILDFLDMDILFVNRSADTVLASTNDLISRLKKCPERLQEVVDLLESSINETEEEEIINEEINEDDE